jgi:ABC-type Fe2+-enterobactin transport system substrate-binding protein
VNSKTSILAFALATVAPIAASAATVDPSTLASGTYTVKVVKVVDAKHIEVVMDSGADTTLAAGRPTVDFSKVQANDQLKLSIVNGTVAVYLDLTTPPH